MINVAVGSAPIEPKLPGSGKRRSLVRPSRAGAEAEPEGSVCVDRGGAGISAPRDRGGWRAVSTGVKVKSWKRILRREKIDRKTP